MNLYALFAAAAMVIVGAVEGKGDAMDINANRRIDHDSALGERIAMASVLVAVLLLIAERNDRDLWPFLIGLPLVCYGAFNLSFRPTLNRQRDPVKEFDYLSLSNRYDATFIGLAGVNAGILAYVTETAALLLGCGITLIH